LIECDLKKDKLLERGPKILGAVLDTVLQCFTNSGYKCKFENGKYTISWYRPEGWDYTIGSENYKKSEQKIKELSEIGNSQFDIEL
jgi:hypothetical protein